MSTVMSTVTSTPMSPGSAPTNPIPRLRRGVSLIVGMDNQPMLFDSDSGKYHRIVAPIVTLLQRLPARALSWVFLALAVCGYAAGAMVLSSLAGGPRPGVLVVITAVVIQLVSILLHESWHAIVAGYLGTPIRGLGVALMFWAIPIAYVDRTDSYRVRSRRGLTMLALAGIFSDGVVCGLEAAIAWASTGMVRQVALTLCAFQLTMLVTNLNPFTQSDGVAAVEAATGSVNLRGRSMFVLRRVLTRQPLPPALAVMRPAVRWGYFIYGLLCSLLGLLVFGMSVVWIGYWLSALLKGFLP